MCASGGNWGLAAAYAAQQLGLEALIILPENTPEHVAHTLRDDVSIANLISYSCKTALILMTRRVTQFRSKLFALFYYA